jgi:hypothetical protein
MSPSVGTRHGHGKVAVLSVAAIAGIAGLAFSRADGWVEAGVLSTGRDAARDQAVAARASLPIAGDEGFWLSPRRVESLHPAGLSAPIALGEQITVGAGSNKARRLEVVEIRALDRTVGEAGGYLVTAKSLDGDRLVMRFLVDDGAVRERPTARGAVNKAL